jgi:hypothetical protein
MSLADHGTRFKRLIHLYFTLALVSLTMQPDREGGRLGRGRSEKGWLKKGRKKGRERKRERKKTYLRLREVLVGR